MILRMFISATQILVIYTQTPLRDHTPHTPFSNMYKDTCLEVTKPSWAMTHGLVVLTFV